MERVAQIQDLLLRSRRLPWVVIGLALLILAATILAGRQQLRDTMRAQLSQRDGEILYAVALMHLQELADAPEAELFGGLDSPDNLITVLLKTSRLKGVVIAARLFGGDGTFIEAFPPDVAPSPLSPEYLVQLQQWRPVSVFRAQDRLSNLFLTTPEEKPVQPVSLLEVNVPLHTAEKNRLLGIAQFIIEGESLALQFARMDRNLALQSLAAFLVSGGLLVGSLTWAFRRLRQSHRLVDERTQSLLKANHELALAAKTSALGAVTSHLIHGLKSPLSGLQSFVNSLDPTRNNAPGAGTSANWEEASAVARRMQTLINQVVSVLREEQGFNQYELTAGDLETIIRARVERLAQQKGVRFSIHFSSLETPLPNRTANLVTLILINLVQNAIEATPPGKAVELSMRRAEEHLLFEVRDQGHGLPAGLRENLFLPCHSNKEHGSGLGLAISKQLASHLRAGLELRSSGPAGSVFALALPWHPG